MPAGVSAAARRLLGRKLTKRLKPLPLFGGVAGNGAAAVQFGGGRPAPLLATEASTRGVHGGLALPLAISARNCGPPVAPLAVRSPAWLPMRRPVKRPVMKCAAIFLWL